VVAFTFLGEREDIIDPEVGLPGAGRGSLPFDVELSHRLLAISGCP
jgi:hypothetical protein